MFILDLIFGFLLVFAGRDLFWLCVGIVGFLIGIQSAAAFGFLNGWTSLIAALAFGSVGIVLAMSFEWVAIVFGVGFLGAGYMLMNVLSTIDGQGFYAWPVFVVGGIVGMCLMIIAFDWTLILISSLLGATLIVNAVHGSMLFRDTLFIISMITGILVQGLTVKGNTSGKYSVRRA